MTAYNILLFKQLRAFVGRAHNEAILLKSNKPVLIDLFTLSWLEGWLGIFLGSSPALNFVYVWLFASFIVKVLGAATTTETADSKQITYE